MAIEYKVELMRSIEERLSTTLNAHDLGVTMDAIREALNAYAVERSDGEEGHNDDMLNAFLTAKSIEGRSEKTIERYRYILTRVLKEIGVSETRITVYHLRGWLMNERRRGISDSTLEGFRSIFSAYFNWLQRETLIANNPCVNLGPIRCPKVMRTPYSDIEIERLKESCSSMRDKAIICFLLSTGCRISEVVALNRDDVDLQGLRCKVCGKGDKERVVYLDNIARMNLRRYEMSRKDDSPALFAGKGTSRLTAGGVRIMLKKLGVAANVENVHPHRFRRTLATNLINRGMPIQEVAHVLGHDKLDTTMEYIYIDNRDVQTSYRKYS